MNYLTFLLAALLFGLSFDCHALVKEDLFVDKAQRETLNQILKSITNSYYAPITNQQLENGILQGIALSLDSQSSYISATEYSEITKITNGEFDGIGIDVLPPDASGLIKVISPYEDGPAFRAGIMPNDVIVAINDVDLEMLPRNLIMDRLRGAIGSKVKLKVIRNNDFLDFEIVREKIAIKPVYTKILPKDNIVYIRIAFFNGLVSKTLRKEYQDICRLLKQTNQLPIKGIILDLRWNPGGLFDQAIAVANLFLSEQHNIVFTKGKSQPAKKYYAKNAAEIEANIPLVTLINRGSASAAEIVAGALKDNGRAILIGEQSFGKASIQTFIPLANGGALKLTTANYHTPAGHNISKSGIAPDITIASQPRDLDRYRVARNKSWQQILADSHVSKAVDVINTMIFLQKSDIVAEQTSH